MNIIGKKYIFLSISGVLIIVSVIAVAVFGFHPGIDFVGGTLWQVKLQTTDYRLQTTDLKDFFENNLGVKNLTVFPSENQTFLLRLGHISENDHQQYLAALKTKFGNVEEVRFESIGPAIGKELRTKAFWAIGLVLLGISLFIAFAFRKVSYPVKSWKYGVITLITLFHDIIIPSGLIAVLGAWKGVELDTTFIVALLVIMGFSVHDTIVVFDRIRENLLLSRERENLPKIVNDSVNQTLARSINTSLTLVLTLLALFFVGPATLRYFILIILAGTIIGTYSSIFVAASLLTLSKSKG